MAYLYWTLKCRRGTGAYKEGNPTAGFYEDGIAKMAYKRIFIKHKKK